MKWLKKIYYALRPILGILLFGVSLYVLHQELKDYHYHDLLRSLEELHFSRVFLALALTALNYYVLTGYDTLAFRYIGHPLQYGKIALVSFIGYAFSHSIGNSLLTNASVRYRLYSSWKLSALEITRVIAFCSVTCCLGFFLIGGVIFLIDPIPLPRFLPLPFTSVFPLGVSFLTLSGGYLLMSALRKKPLEVRQREYLFPHLPEALGQFGVSSLDWLLGASVLYVLFPSASELPFTRFLGIYLLAQIAGMISQIPAGLGIFESSFLLLLPSTISSTDILGSLLIYRGVYYLLPLGMATVLFGIHEALEKKERLRKLAAYFGQWVPDLTPLAFSFASFLGGAMLVFSGALPSASGRLSWLKRFLPLPVLEISHFLGSLAGVGLILLAQGLQRRLDAAYLLTALLLGLGVVLSLLRGFHYEEAIVLAIMLAALLPCRPHFYRKAALTSERFTAGWIAAIAVVVFSSVWLGLFSYKHVEYSHDLWWRFALEEDVSRFLRTTVGVIVAFFFFGLTRLLAPAQPEPLIPKESDLQKARTVTEKSSNPWGNLALLGDKELLFSETGNAFVMYGIERRSWIALGDPIGPEGEMRELVWRFRELCDRYNGRTVFYDVGQRYLPLYIDLGLTLTKVGEEARVSLEGFSLEGGEWRKFRNLCHRFEGEGFRVEIVPREAVRPLSAELREISDEWLALKDTREKRFSVGCFNERYLEEFSLGLVRQRGRVVAFTNILRGAKEELACDLVRHRKEAPDNTMDFLFIQLMLWGRHEGFRWFNLGSAPLSGLEDHALAPLWHRFGALIYGYGERFYNFQGVREYKEKFHAAWEPKYLASPGGFVLPTILTDLASLVAGGLKGIVTK